MKILFDFILSIIRNFTNNKTEEIKTIENKNKGIKIVIDPGHGGRKGRPDPGAIGKYNNETVYERNVVLSIAAELAFILDENGFDIIMTRIDNKMLSELKDKVNIVNEENPDIFVSIHTNANSGSPASGIETFYHTNKVGSKKLAECIQNSLLSKFPSHKNRGIKEGNWLYILKKVKINACCLVECEFINNPIQVKFLVDRKVDIAKAIYSGILEFLE